MKVYELVKLQSEILKKMSENGIKTSDHKYVKMYEEYRIMKNRDYKVTYIVALLTYRYQISERTFFRIVRRFETDCQ